MQEGSECNGSKLRAVTCIHESTYDEDEKVSDTDIDTHVHSIHDDMHKETVSNSFTVEHIMQYDSSYHHIP